MNIALEAPGSNDDVIRFARVLARVQDAVDVLLKRLDALEPTTDVMVLRAAAMRRLREAQAWYHDSPSLADQERVMQRVLGLHFGIAALERRSRV
jgi:hypothetical protein